MITNFEHLTGKLTDVERDHWLPLIIRGLSLKVGKHTAISNKEMRKKLNQNHLTGDIKPISDVRLRKIINFIRINGLIPCLLSNSNGYYVSNDYMEIESYMASLEERAQSIMAVKHSLFKQYVLLQKRQNEKV